MVRAVRRDDDELRDRVLGRGALNGGPDGKLIVQRKVSETQPFSYAQAWTDDNRLASVVKTDLTGLIVSVTTDWYYADRVRMKKDDPDETALYG